MNLRIKIKPGSKKNQLQKDASGGWQLRVKSPPVDGRANEEVVQLLSGILSISKSAIILKSGQRNSQKLFQVEILSEDEVNKRMENYLVSQR